jgi:hypothetical protein
MLFLWESPTFHVKSEWEIFLVPKSCMEMGYDACIPEVFNTIPEL